MNGLQRPCSLWWVRWRANPPDVWCETDHRVLVCSPRTGNGFRIWAIGSGEAEKQVRDMLKQLGYTCIRVNCTGIFNLGSDKKTSVDKKKSTR